MKTILIKNGTVYDGLGNPGQKADVYLADGKVEKIAPALSCEADIVIDASGKAVTPGIVDIHRHHDAKPLNDPAFGLRELRQGITTAVSGNCGISMVPRPEDPERAKEYYAFEEAVRGPIGLDGPVTYREYLDALRKADLPLNTAAMIGTGTAKICVKNFSDTPYTEEELEKTEALIEDALAQGAPAISLGIMYLPECYSSTEEFARILRPVGKYGRVITTHIRGEGDSMVDSVKEVIEIARKTGCALEISHFKSCGMKNWRKEIHRAILINKSYSTLKQNGKEVFQQIKLNNNESYKSFNEKFTSMYPERIQLAKYDIAPVNLTNQPTNINVATLTPPTEPLANTINIALEDTKEELSQNNKHVKTLKREPGFVSYVLLGVIVAILSLIGLYLLL